MIGTYLSLFKCLVRLITQRICRILGFFDRPMPSKPGMHTDLISNPALLSNKFVSLLSDL